MTETTHEPEQAKKPSSDGLDKYVFLAFLVAGTIAITSMKHFNFDQLEVTGVPVLLLLLYAIAASFLPRFRLRADRVADNSYYMGFLFTLVSLAYALYQFETGDEGTATIVENFGIALASTIVGLALRVFINQFREDPIEIEREARLELAEAASRLRAELNTVIRDFKLSVVEMGQAVEESVEANAKGAGESFNAIAIQFREVSDEVVLQLKRSFESQSTTTKKLNRASERTVSAIESVIHRLEQIEAPRDLLSARLEPTIEHIEKAARILCEQQEAETERLAKAGAAAEKAVNAAASLDDHFRRVAQHFQALDQLSAHIGKLRQSLDNAIAPSKDLAQVPELFAQTIGIIKAHNQALEAEIEKSRAATLRVQSQLADAAELVIERLGPGVNGPNNTAKNHSPE